MDILTSFLQMALDCAARGWYVFPCIPRTKQPLGGLVPNGWHDASNDEATIRRWWSVKPDANVAIACGASGLAVLDVDHGLADDNAALAWLGAHDIPPTYMVRTGRRPEFGLQIYFFGAMPDVGAWELGGCSGQVKSAGGYVMAAGSIHPDTGKEYTVKNSAPLAPTPDWVRSLKKVSAAPREPGKKLAVGEGRRPALTSIAGTLRNRGLEWEAIYAGLVPINPAMCEVPISDDDLEHIAKSVCRYDVPAPEPVAVLGTAKQPDPVKLPERVRPVYPISAWEGTVVAEFAKLCANDNNIPRKMYAESFRCALGAVVGDRISCPAVEGALPRTYTIIVAPKGKGKGTAIRRAVKFFSSWYGTRSAPGMVIQGDMTGLLSGERDFVWKPKGIGAWLVAASSVPGMGRICKDLESTIKNKPQLTWGPTLPRILSVHEEMKTLLSSLFIKGGVGSGLEGVICQLWDDVTFNGNSTGQREPVYGEMMFSMLCGVTEQDWFNLLGQGDAVGGGLVSRFNLIGTEGGFENVGRMYPPDFADLQESFFPRIFALEDARARIPASEAADSIISEWTDNLPEGSERMNIHAWRSALLLAWLRHEESITAKTAEDAVRLGEYQIASQEYYRPKSADTPNAKVQAKILRALEVKGPLTKRELQRHTHAERDGTELWNRSLGGLLQDKAVGQGEDKKYYRAE